MRLIDNRVAVDCQSLIKDFGLSRNTVYGGINEYQKLQTYNWENYKNGKIVFVFVDTIPYITRKKLPDTSKLKAMMKSEEHDCQTDIIVKALRYAKANKFIDYRSYYRDRYGLSAEKTLDVAMKRAVWDRVLQIYSENKIGKKGGLKRGVLTVLHKAFIIVYPESYVYESFCRAIKDAEDKGVDAVCINGNAIKSNEKPGLKYDERHLFLTRAVVSSGKAYKAPKIREILADMCETEGIPCPSLSWIKKQKIEILKNIEVHSNRYGADSTDKITPYTGIKPAYNADDQWQIDGWDFPFYYYEDKSLKKLTLIAVRDAYSRKIVGFSISKTENRLSILEALQDAVGNTGALAFELVSDNHSYNQTKEVGFFKSEAEKLGFNWTVDQNPRRKAIAERFFGILGEGFCKDHYSYLGQGIKTRDKDGRTKQELIDKYLKAGKILSENEIKLIAIDVVHQFNRTKLGNSTKSPNQLYAESKKPHRIEIDLFERLRLFTKQTEYKVSRGQINITVAGADYQFQLSSDLYAKYNGTKVCVRYDTLDTIYLFDLRTDKPICSLQQKEMAAGALANQTDKDIEILNRSTGRLKGIKSTARKENEEIAAKAERLSPTIFETLNKRLTPKDTSKLLEEEYVTQEANKRGIDLSRIAHVTPFSEVENPAFVERKRSRKETSPFSPDHHQISTISFEE